MFMPNSPQVRRARPETARSVASRKSTSMGQGDPVTQCATNSPINAVQVMPREPSPAGDVQTTVRLPFARDHTHLVQTW